MHTLKNGISLHRRSWFKKRSNIYDFWLQFSKSNKISQQIRHVKVLMAKYINPMLQLKQKKLVKTKKSTNPSSFYYRLMFVCYSGEKWFRIFAFQIEKFPRSLPLHFGSSPNNNYNKIYELMNQNMKRSRQFFIFLREWVCVCVWKSCI